MQKQSEFQVKAYLAHAMTGLDSKEVRDLSDKSRKVLEHHGIESIDPLDIEIDLHGHDGTIPNRPDEVGKKAWYSDKEAIRKVHVVVDITPWIKSEGVLRELGYARFHLFKPVVRVYRPGDDPHMVTVFEDDLIVYSLEEAAHVILDRWGTWRKRVVWRIKMLFKSLPKFIWRQILEFK